MKKIIKLLTLITLMFSLSSCAIIYGLIYGYNEGIFDSPYTYEGNDYKLLDDALIDVKNNQRDGNQGVGISSTGTNKVLVVPVQFKPITISTKSFGTFKNTDLAKLENIFTGSYENNGWYSVQEFYNKSSYGKLDLQFDFADVFTCTYDFTYYQSHKDSDRINDGDKLVLKEFLDAKNYVYDFSQYDNNKDGYIDAIYLVYSIPFYGSSNASKTLSNNQNSDFWWAWVNWASDDTKYDGVQANYFMWASIDFVNEPIIYSDNPLIKDTTINVNANTFIHETGHLLGLDDYYNYIVSDNHRGGLGGADLMDAAVGDHGAISKILLGWVSPQIVRESGTYSIVSMQASTDGTGCVLLIPKDINSTSYFKEYYLVDLYTPTGLNSMHKGYSGLFSTSGVRLLQVDATISSEMGVQFDSDYYTMFSYNNSTTSHPFVKMIEGDNNNSLMRTVNVSGSIRANDATNSDLFYSGYSRTNLTWYDKTPCGFVISFSNVSSTSATVTVTYTDL